MTVDDEGYCSYYVIANFDQIKRDYTGAILKFETRAVDWMWLLASYTWATSEGSIEDTQGAFSDYDYCPEHCVNRYGYLSDDRRHRVKLNGYFMLPLNFTLGVDAFWSSAFAYSKTQAPTNTYYGTEYLEPRGNYRANDNYEMDLSLTYRLNLGQVGVELIGSVVNVFDTELVTGVCEDINGCGSNAFGDPDVWQTPRRYEILMDIQMPEMDGLEASRQINARWQRDQRPLIVALTANAMDSDRQACFDAGMDDYITKPIRVDELVGALNRVKILA